MSKSTTTQAIVAAVDFDETGPIALDEAIRLAGVTHNAIVHAIHVSAPRDATKKADAPSTDHGPATEADVALERLENLCRQRLAAVQTGDSDLTFIKLITHVSFGRPVPVIVDIAKTLNADLIVIGTHDRTGLKKLVLGSVAKGVMESATCPVLVTRKKDHAGLGDVPAIEPACEACLEVRMRESDPKLWCERHQDAAFRPLNHHYRYVTRSPTGSRPLSRN